MKTIKISRPKQFVDYFRSYKLWIDEELVGKIKRGKSIELTINPDSKKLIATIDWCSSQKYSLSTLSNGDELVVKNANGHTFSRKLKTIPAITTYKAHYLEFEKVR